MTAPIARLKQRAEFLRVAGTRRKWAMPGLVLQAAKSDAAEAAPGGIRVGFTASRRVGSAVARNRARRRLRAVVGRVMADRATRGQDYVVIARRETLTRAFAHLVDDLETALDRIASKPGRRPPPGIVVGGKTTS